MKHLRQQKYLPHAPADIYDLIMDVSSYPIIFPMVKSARVKHQAAGWREIALEFNLPSFLRVADPVHVTRVTGQKPDWIKADKVTGPLKALDLHWDLKPAAKGGTDMIFHMDYEGGLGFLADAFLSANLGSMLAQALNRFEAHAAQKLTAGAAVAANQNQVPVQGRSRKKGDPVP